MCSTLLPALCGRRSTTLTTHLASGIISHVLGVNSCTENFSSVGSTNRSSATRRANAHSPSSATRRANAHSPSFATRRANAHSPSFATRRANAHSPSFATRRANAHSPSFATRRANAHSPSFVTRRTNAQTIHIFYTYCVINYIINHHKHLNCFIHTFHSSAFPVTFDLK